MDECVLPVTDGSGRYSCSPKERVPEKVPTDGDGVDGHRDRLRHQDCVSIGVGFDLETITWRGSLGTPGRERSLYPSAQRKGERRETTHPVPFLRTRNPGGPHLVRRQRRNTFVAPVTLGTPVVKSRYVRPYICRTQKTQTSVSRDRPSLVGVEGGRSPPWSGVPPRRTGDAGESLIVVGSPEVCPTRS